MGGDFHLAEKMSEVYSAYDIQINQVMRGRGAYVLRTDKGIFQLKPMDGSPSRLGAEYEFKVGLVELGFESIDYCVKNVDGELYTCDRYGNPYVLRRFFLGRECNPLNQQDVIFGVRNLARFHQVGKRAFEQSEKDVHIRITGDFKKKNQGIKRVNNYILKQKSKRDFETKFLKTFDYFYDQGVKCQQEFEELSQVGGKEVYDDNEFEAHNFRHLGYCHGMYNHHSLVITDGVDVPIGTIGFDKFYLGNQMDDLYHYARKMVEKNDYSFKLLTTILDEYSKVNPLDRQDYQYIYINYCYPEKFYKLGNQYMNGSKNWLSPKLQEKLDRFIEDEGKKQLLLDKMKKMYL